MEKVIEAINLSHSYGNKEIYRDLNFSIEKGRIFGLLGKNGVGKTTTINILMGFLRPSGGKCVILGEESHQLSPATRAKIGLLHETHLQYDFMTIEQIEKFYSAFFPRWQKDVYYDLMKKMPLSNDHKICHMSCGQRSQVALGLILAQDPDLLILDDYSMGLDAGYRRLFLEYLHRFVKENNKTVFVTSHIISDLEVLVDDMLFMSRGGYILQTNLEEFLNSFNQYKFTLKSGNPEIEPNDIIKNIESYKDEVTVYSFENENTVASHLKNQGLNFDGITKYSMSLEDAFLGLTGKY